MRRVILSLITILLFSCTDTKVPESQKKSAPSEIISIDTDSIIYDSVKVPIENKKEYDTTKKINKATKGSEIKNYSDLPVQETPRTLAVNLLNSFVHNDSLLYSSLFISDLDCDTILLKSSAPDSLKSDPSNIFKWMVKSKKYKKENFEKLRNEVIKKGIDWSKVELVDVFYEIKEKHHVQTCDIFLSCKSGEKKLAFKSGAIKSSRWLAQGKTSLYFEN